MRITFHYSDQEICHYLAKFKLVRRMIEQKAKKDMYYFESLIRQGFTADDAAEMLTEPDCIEPKKID